MMDAILLHLSKIEDIRVLDRTSVEQYRGTKKTTLQISKELGVVYVLEGSFQKHEDNVRLIVQLTEASEQGHVWANEYNNKWNEIFSVQSEVAHTIANELNAAITPEENQLITKTPTADLTAYDLTLQAQKFYYEYYLSLEKSDVELEKVKQLCKAALELDPGFAQTYYWLGESSLSDQYASGYTMPFYLDTALYFFNKAVELDATLAEAYVGRGRYYQEKAERQKAIDDLKKSISLSPNNSLAYYYLGLTYFISRDYDHALINLTKAEKLIISDATQSSIYEWIIYIYLSAGDLQKAALYCQELEQYSMQLAVMLDIWMAAIQGKWEEMLTRSEKFITLYPEIADSYDTKARALLGLGRIQEAEDFMRESLKYSGPILNNAHRVGIVLWMNGKRDEAMKYFNMQINNCNESIKLKTGYGQVSATYDLAGVYAFLGNKEEAYKWLREYKKLGFMTGLHENIKVDPLFENLRNDNEFKEIVKKGK